MLFTVMCILLNKKAKGLKKLFAKGYSKKWKNQFAVCHPITKVICCLHMRILCDTLNIR